MVHKRHAGKQSRQATTKQKARRPSSPLRKSPKRLNLQKRAYQVFDEQADSLWNGLTNQCREFADGFNRALGSQELHVHAEPNTLRVAYPRADTELFLQLDKAERFLQASLNNGCADGSCLSDQRSVGLTVNGNELQFVLGGEIVSGERLAVTLLTQLTSAKPEQDPA